MNMELSRQSDHELLSHTAKLVGSHRRITAKLVACLAEIEERRLHVVAGFGSMFEFCVKELGFSEGEAFRRILAARLARRFPIVYERLASGAVHLSALELLREHLTVTNHLELLDAASHKSKREVEALVASRFPRPDAPTRIRREHIEQLSEARFKVEFTASAELREKLELCRDLLSHANPSRDLGFVVERAVDRLLDDLGRRRFARVKRAAPATGIDETDGVEDMNGLTDESHADDVADTKRLADVGRRAPGKPRKPSALQPKQPATVPRAVRRDVFARDGLRCTYLAPDGRRCDSRAFLELDHVVPKAAGGTDGSDNLRVRCRAHNQLWAEQSFGRDHVEWRRHLRRKKSTPATSGHTVRVEQPVGGSALQRVGPKGNTSLVRPVYEKLRLALCGMGFRVSLARRAVAKVVALHAGETPDVAALLREAVLVATAA